MTTSPGRDPKAPASRAGRRVLVGLVVLGALAAVLVLLGPGLSGGLRAGTGFLQGTPDCIVRTADGEIGLSRDEARLATTAAALRARGAEAPDTSDIDPSALERLVDGPLEDAGPSLACRGTAAGALPEEEIGASGLTPRAERVRSEMAAVFGEQSLGGFAPGGVDQGHGGESTHYDGRAIDVFFRPVTEVNRRAGWLLAHWLVAHADRLDLQYVIFDDRVWSSLNTRARWYDYDAPSPANEILRHLDHVHVDVHRGGAGGG